MKVEDFPFWREYTVRLCNLQQLANDFMSFKGGLTDPFTFLANHSSKFVASSGALLYDVAIVDDLMTRRIGSRDMTIPWTDGQ
jgi:hypothetical protein